MAPASTRWTPITPPRRTPWHCPRRPRAAGSAPCCGRSAQATVDPGTTRCGWPPPTATCSTTSTAMSNRDRGPQTRRRAPPTPRARRTCMALTGDAKEELSHLEITRPSARKAEAAATLRFAGALHLVAGRVVVEAELDSAAVARRLHANIADKYGHRADVAVLAPSGISRTTRYSVRVDRERQMLAPSSIRRTTRYIVRDEREGQMLARQTGLLDARGRPVRGMPPFVVGGATVDAEAAWRGAFLARGSLTEPGRSSALELSCPGP